jgi:GH15 family glucan-1,4-alpha-glucosidase
MASNLELGVIGNCQVGALIDRNGRYVWACVPRLDGDPVFCSLLRDDPESETRGFFSVELNGEVRSEQVYERNTAVLSTILTNADGARIRILDFCPRFRQYGRNFRPVSIIRIVEPIAGHAAIRVRLRPLSHYGKQAAVRHIGSNHIRFESQLMTWRMSTDMSLNALLEERPIVLREPFAFVLGADETVPENIGTLTKLFLF